MDNGFDFASKRLVSFSKVQSYRYLHFSSGVEVDQGFLDTSGHGLLTLTDPDTGVVEFLVGLVLSVRVADLGHEIILLVEDVVTNTRQVCPLQIGIKVDLADTIADGLTEFFLGGTGSTVEDEENGLVFA